MNGFVIYLSSEDRPKDSSNAYGYWTGKHYKVQGETFPCTTDEITSETKIYKSKVMAEKMARKLQDRMGYVSSWLVEEIQGLKGESK